MGLGDDVSTSGDSAGLTVEWEDGHTPVYYSLHVMAAKSLL